LGGTYGDLKVADGSHVRLRGRRRPVLSVGAKTANLFDREHKRAWRERGPWSGSADVVWTTLVCPTRGGK
jgi:hypothetical protein